MTSLLSAINRKSTWRRSAPSEKCRRSCGRLLAAVVCILLFASSGVAAETADGPQSPRPTGLAGIDLAIIGAYLVATISLGVYYGRKQTSTQEYFVGSGHMNPIVIGVSLFATLLSTISYLSMPGEAASKGPVGALQLFALPLVFLIVAYGLLPVYMRHRVTSAYELLELKLGLSVRLLGACMFLTLRLVWMTLLVYLAAKAMSVMLGVDYWTINLDEWTVQASSVAHPAPGEEGVKLAGSYLLDGALLRIASIPVLVMFVGFVAVIYTSLGGLRAVVVTDCMQTLLLFGGAWLVIAVVTYDYGSFAWFPTQWRSTWDTQPLFSFDPRTRMTMIGTIVTGVIWQCATAGGDQTSVQRFMATKDATAARRALAVQLIVNATVIVTLFTVGFALWSFFQSNMEALPAGTDLKEDGDMLFPRFISFHLPAGISGLVVAAMFAAAMSSIDSGVNSITAVVMTDFLDRFGIKPKTEKGHLLCAKLLAFSIGCVVVLGSSSMKYIEGNITAITNKTANLLTTPIFALFCFALFIPFARPLGVWCGAFFGTATAAAIAFSGPLVVLLHSWLGIDPGVFGVELLTKADPVTGETWTTAQDPVSFQWIAPMALSVNLLVGSAVSWVICRRESGKPKDAIKSG